jgi:hypothetical protein
MLKNPVIYLYYKNCNSPNFLIEINAETVIKTFNRNMDNNLNNVQN